MLVYVKAKQMAVSGLLAAFTVLLISLGAVFETNTLFLLCVASYCVGIAIREWGLGYGAAFLTACTLLGVMIAPNKIYCITFTAMSIYLWCTEVLWRMISKSEKLTHRTAVLWCGKYVIFNLIYIPLILLMPQLLIAKRLNGIGWLAVWAAGQIGVLIFDKAHTYFQIFVWNKIRKYVLK